MMHEEHEAGWEAFKQKQVLATMQRHPNPYTRWGLTHAPRWLLVYEDVDMPSVVFDDPDEAFLHFAKAEQRGWNCSLFVTERRVPAPEAVGELLAIIHGDGGHYQVTHGVEKAAQDAMAKVNELRQIAAQVQEVSSLRSVADKLRQGGASLPAPQVTGTIEGSIVTGLSIALAVVEEAIARSEREMSRAMDTTSPTGAGQQGTEWRAKWPNHCHSCGGWGGKNHVQSQPYGSTRAGESLFDPCAATADARTCHRCGQKGLTADGEGPCKHCGWDCDDGDPDRS